MRHEHQMRGRMLAGLPPMLVLGFGCQLISGLGELAPGDHAAGQRCESSVQCASERCVDGVCCDSPCDGSCEICNPLGAEGICSPQPAFTDPDGECDSGICDGAGHCAEGGHLWAARFGDSEEQYGYGVAVDSQGSVVLVGTFAGEIDFGNGALVDQGQGDVFVAKLGPDGEHRWSRRYGDAQGQAAYEIAVDPSDDLVVTGRFQGEIDFGDGPRSAAPMGSSFVVKLSGDGGCLWSRSFATAGVPRVAVDRSSGDVVIAGWLSAPTDFGTGEPLAPTGPEDAYVARYSPDGVLRWATSFPSETVPDPPDVDPAVVIGLEVDSTGSVVLTGNFAQRLIVGSNTMDNGSIGYDVYVAKLGPGGEHRWSAAFGGAWSQLVTGFALDAFDNVVLSGTFLGSIAFGGDTLEASALDVIEIFVARLGPDGQHQMSQGLPGGGLLELPDGTPIASLPNGLVLDQGGNVLMSGVLASAINIGGNWLQSAGEYDLFFAKFTPDVQHLYSKRYGDPLSQYPAGSAIDSAGNLVLTGYFVGQLPVGGVVPLIADGEMDVFVAKFSP